MSLIIRLLTSNGTKNGSLLNLCTSPINGMLSTACSANNIRTRQRSTIKKINLGRKNRGDRQRQRNLEALSKMSGGSNGDSQKSQIPLAFYLLGVFPLVATGGLAYLNDDMRQDLVKKLDWR